MENRVKQLGSASYRLSFNPSKKEKFLREALKSKDDLKLKAD